jgi:hypothetical protein
MDVPRVLEVSLRDVHAMKMRRAVAKDNLVGMSIQQVRWSPGRPVSKASSHSGLFGRVGVVKRASIGTPFGCGIVGAGMG